MKVGFIASDKEFNNKAFEAIKAALPKHELISWSNSKNAPAHDFEVLLVIGDLTRQQMESQPNLKLVQTVSAGYDGIDVKAATELGIAVSYAPSELTGNAVSVAEFAVLLMLSASRYLGQAIQPQQDNALSLPGVTPALSGKTVCIVGLGSIGKMVAERLIPFGMQITGTDDHPKGVPENVKVYPSNQIATAVAKADYVVLCIRATAENENLVDEHLINRMKKGAMLINIARGSLIDEGALIKAVKSGHITAAGLDVVKDEPLKANNPLLSLPQLIVTPHVAGTTDITLQGCVAYCIKVINDLAEGQMPESVVNNL